MRKIKLTMGKVAIVDNEDYAILSEFNWSAHKSNGKYRSDIRYYAENAQLGKMHRFILRYPKGMEIDHINGNTLDNRRNNLRVCNRSQNGQNKYSKAKGKMCKFKGVTYEARFKKKKWRAVITLNYKKYHLGRFETDIEAAKAYDKKALELHGEYAHTNEMLKLY